MPAKRIYINGKFLCQKTTGVQRFALGISLALQHKYPDIAVIAPRGTYEHHGLYLKKSGFGRGFLWEQIWLPLFMLFHPHCLLINFCNTAPLLIKKQIVTIHDLAFLKNKSWFSASFRRWYQFLIPRICRRSLEILTVSQWIKNEIGHEYSIKPTKISVVPNGIPEIKYNDQRPYDFRYLLLTGIYNPRKNASFVLSHLDEIKKRGYHIVGVGQDAPTFGTIEFMPDDHLHLLKYVDDLHFYTLMKHADALIFPSEYEGFGIPVLEALTIGTPVILPNIPVYKESFGELPLYYSAGDVVGFFQALDKIYVHKPSINELSNLKNKFTFDKAADILSAILKQYEANTKQKSKES